MPFPDGTGTSGGLSPFDGVFSAEGGLAAPVVPSFGPGPLPGLPGGESMWPEGLRPSTVADDASGMPPWVANPDAFVPPPDQLDEEGGSFAPIALSRAAPATTFDVEAALRAQLEAAGAPAIDHAAALERIAPGSTTDDGKGHLAILYGVGVPLSLSAQAGENGIDIWKVACKTGTLALSPGPGQVDLDQPLTLTGQDFDDVLEAYVEKAMPYVTVPETHANGALENTGYVKALEKLSKDELMADARITQEGKDHVSDDPEDTEYLLAGIGFTKASAREAALEGSIPDTSIGLKMNYRYKRTGKTYRRALEHLALTPVPWVDGLIPFNPAMALSAQSWDQREPGETTVPVVLDGVWTEPPRLDLSMEVRINGGDFDAAATRAALLALKPGDSLAWNWEVNVERLAAESTASPDAAYFLVRAPESVDPSDYEWERKPKLYSDLDGAMRAVVAGVAVCMQRKANEQARRSEHEAGMAQPVMAKYSVNLAAPTALNLSSFIRFDPSKHPRDVNGQWRKTVGALEDGQQASLPDGNNVYKDKDGFHVDLREKGDKEDKVESKTFKDSAEAAAAAIEHSAKKTDPDSVGGETSFESADAAEATLHDEDVAKGIDWGVAGSRQNYIDAAEEFLDGEIEALDGEDPGDDYLNEVGDLLRDQLVAPGTDETGPEVETIPGGVRLPDGTEITTDGFSVDVSEPTKPAAKSAAKTRPADKGTKLSASQGGPAPEGDTLSLSGAPDSLNSVTNHGAREMTVEELLAQQQAEIEQLKADLASAASSEANLSAQVKDQGQSLHVGNVGKAIRKLNGKYPPTILLAAQTIMLNDKPWERPEEGFNLSVQAPSAADPTKMEDRELATPTDVVQFMLSAMPTIDGQGLAAVQLATIAANLDDVQLSAHRDTNPEAEARSAVDEWHRKARPELYDADGKLIAA